MKRYGFVKCWPVDIFCSGNSTLAECRAESVEAAALIFSTLFNIRLNTNGYAKVGEITYTVAECYERLPVQWVSVRSKPLNMI